MHNLWLSCCQAVRRLCGRGDKPAPVVCYAKRRYCSASTVDGDVAVHVRVQHDLDREFADLLERARGHADLRALDLVAELGSASAMS
jgi:hypothetical protein